MPRSPRRRPSTLPTHKRHHRSIDSVDFLNVPPTKVSVNATARVQSVDRVFVRATLTVHVYLYALLLLSVLLFRLYLQMLLIVRTRRWFMTRCPVILMPRYLKILFFWLVRLMLLFILLRVIDLVLMWHPSNVLLPNKNCFPVRKLKALGPTLLEF